MTRIPVSIQHILFWLILFLLIVPFLQEKIKISAIWPLKGAVVLNPDSEFSFDGWLSGTFQEEKEKYLNENFGFRNYLVRLNNQISFSFFNKANAKAVVIGKNNYLYEKNYIKAYFGSDFIGSDSILHQVQKLKFIADTLARLNKDLILVFAPGKASFFPEYIPEKYLKQRKETNFEYYLKFAKENNLNVIDFNTFFKSQKGISQFPLYPKYGIHWSYYSVCLATDSIIKYIEYLRHTDIPDIIWEEIKIEPARNGDNDILEGMNLLFVPKHEKLAYQQFHFGPVNGNPKPSVLTISDSFYWSIYNMGILNSLFKNSFWFYNREIYPDFFIKPKYTEHVDVMDEIQKHDLILIMAGEATLTNFGWGFIDIAYDLFRGIDNGHRFSKEFYQKVSEMRDYIRKDSVWFDKIKVKAQERKISVDSMITLDAIWLLQNK